MRVWRTCLFALAPQFSAQPGKGSRCGLQVSGLLDASCIAVREVTDKQADFRSDAKIDGATLLRTVSATQVILRPVALQNYGNMTDLSRKRPMAFLKGVRN